MTMDARIEMTLRWVGVTVGLVLAGPLAGQDRIGTLLVAHGADSAWNARVEAVARAADTGGPVAVTFLMGPGAQAWPFQAQVQRLQGEGAERVVVVPLLVSSHSGHFEQIRWLARQTDSLDHAMRHHLHEGGIDRADSAVPIVLAPGMDAAPEVARVLADRARALLAGDDPARHALFLIAHGPNGPEEHAEWMRALRILADSVQRALGFRDARAGVVRDDAPPAVRAEAVRGVRDVIALQAAATGQEVVVVPVAISHGAFTDIKLRADLAGLPVRYDAEPLLPHEQVVRWVVRQVREAAGR
jgi:sirohydrochlorin ferrochelatase